MPNATRISFLGGMSRDSFLCRHLLGAKAGTVWFFLLVLLVGALAPGARGQSIVATATATWTYSAVEAFGDPIGTITDGLNAAMQGQIVMSPDTNGNWVVVSSNYSVSVSGMGMDPPLLGGDSWTWLAGNPNGAPNDGAVVFLEYDDNNSLNPFDYGWVVVGIECPWVETSPPNAPTAFDNTDDSPLLTLPMGNMTVSTNNQSFSVSDGESTNGYPITGDGISITSMGTVSYTVSYQPVSPDLTLVSVQTPATVNGNQHTFISTDTITLNASVGGGKGGVPVTWTVTSLNSAAPSKVVTGVVVNSGPGGISTFSFTPSQSGTLAPFRQKQFTSGSRTANDPLSFEVMASAEGKQVTLSQSGIGTLMQDDTDTLRQEYVDFQLTVPDRSKVVPTIDDGTGNQYNMGNYDVQVSVALPAHYTAILAAYRAQTTVVNGTTVGIPADATITISSGYRNPRRNKAAGSVHNTQGDISRHVLGSAFDLVPDGVKVMINNKRVRLGLHANLYPALCAAASSVGVLHVLPEIGCCTIVDCGAGEDHTHVDW